MRRLNREVTKFAVGHLIAELRGSYRDLPAVLAYLDAVERDIMENADGFLSSGQRAPNMAGPAT